MALGFSTNWFGLLTGFNFVVPLILLKKFPLLRSWSIYCFLSWEPFLYDNNFATSISSLCFLLKWRTKLVTDSSQKMQTSFLSQMRLFYSAVFLEVSITAERLYIFSLTTFCWFWMLKKERKKCCWTHTKQKYC